LPQLILDIAVPTPLRRSFHYLPPDDFPSTTRPGCRLRVPFGSKQMVGVLLGYANESASDKLRHAIELVDTEPVMPETLLQLCVWAADYYHHPVGDVLASALPVLLRKGDTTERLIRRLFLATKGLETEPESIQRAPRQTEALRYLRQLAPAGASRDQLRQQAISTATIRALAARQLVEWQETNISPKTFKIADIDYSGITLNAEQSTALGAIETPDGAGETFLIQGITGSGKTEIYLRAIESRLRRHQQVLVLVPEIGLTPQTVERFTHRFNLPIAVIHSGLTDKERLKSWQMAACGEAAIIIGTRSAVFTPMARPGLIVVDEEHDASLKQQDGFKYSARDLAVLRGRLEQISVLLGSATPSLESLHNAQLGKYRLLHLHHRPVGIETETYQVLSLKHQQVNEGFSKPLLQKMHTHLNNGSQVLVFLNRRGFAPVLLCQECHWIANCRRCDARLTCHLSMQRLICHHCGFETAIPKRCDQCQATQLTLLGLGTQRVEQFLKSQFPDIAVVRIDRDSTRRKGTLDTMLATFASGDPAILVGTQMVAKGHHFTNVTLSAIIDIDSSFYSADYKSMERMGQLILQVGGRSGRSNKPGSVVVQTHFPDQPALRQLINDGYTVFAENLLQERQANELPPFTYQALIRAESNSRTLAMEFLETLNGKNSRNPSVELLGPIPSTMEKRAGYYRALLLFSSPSRAALHAELSERIVLAENSALGRKVRWAVDVDPMDLY
jgi:primosomal protein N' (replication factor Y) (superfamily II helicase)